MIFERITSGSASGSKNNFYFAENFLFFSEIYDAHYEALSTLCTNVGAENKLKL